MAETKVLSPTEVAEEHQKEAHAPYLMVWFWLWRLDSHGVFLCLLLQGLFPDPPPRACCSWRASRPGWWAGTSCT